MLVISNALNDSSSGLVIRNFVNNAKAKSRKVHGLFEEIAETDKNDNFFSLGKIRLLNRFEKILLILFNHSFGCRRRSKLLYQEYIKDKLLNEDQIIIYVTGVNFFTIYSIVEILNSGLISKVYVHFLDTIISKNTWGENRYVTNAKKKLIQRELKKRVNRISFSFTNNEASILIQKTLGVQLNSAILYSYSVENYSYSFNLNPKQKLIFYFRGTLDENRKSHYILELFNSFSQRFDFFEFIFQGKIKCPEGFNKSDNLTILPFSREIEWLHKADIFIDVDLFLDDVYIPGKFFEYISFKKPILSITPWNSALRRMYETDLIENSAIFLCDFNDQSILNQLNIIEERFVNKSSVNLSFYNVKTLDDLILG